MHICAVTVNSKTFFRLIPLRGITPAEPEYRAKLVELHYSGDLGLLQKFLSEADESKTNDSHALASAQLKPEFEDADQSDLARIRTRALELFYAHTKKMEEKYGGQRMNAANSD